MQRKTELPVKEVGRKGKKKEKAGCFIMAELMIEGNMPSTQVGDINNIYKTFCMTLSHIMPWCHKYLQCHALIKIQGADGSLQAPERRRRTRASQQVNLLTVVGLLVVQSKYSEWCK